MKRRDETQPSFAHMLINKLSAVVGQCQLLEEDLPKDAEKCINRVRLIQSVANSMLEEIKAKQRSVNAIPRAG